MFGYYYVPDPLAKLLILMWYLKKTILVFEIPIWEIHNLKKWSVMTSPQNAQNTYRNYQQRKKAGVLRGFEVFLSFTRLLNKGKYSSQISSAWSQGSIHTCLAILIVRLLQLLIFLWTCNICYSVTNIALHKNCLDGKRFRIVTTLLNYHLCELQSWKTQTSFMAFLKLASWSSFMLWHKVRCFLLFLQISPFVRINLVYFCSYLLGICLSNFKWSSNFLLPNRIGELTMYKSNDVSDIFRVHIQWSRTPAV